LTAILLLVLSKLMAFFDCDRSIVFSFGSGQVHNLESFEGYCLSNRFLC